LEELLLSSPEEMILGIMDLYRQKMLSQGPVCKLANGWELH